VSEKEDWKLSGRRLEIVNGAGKMTGYIAKVHSN
jgi:hypothetical protein